VAKGDQINIKPQFKSKTVPCEGEAGDLLVLSPLAEGDVDPTPQGLTTLWFCIKSANPVEQRKAVWARVKFDGFATCDTPVLPDPPILDPIRQG
jgi:hypothetical protein